MKRVLFRLAGVALAATVALVLLLDLGVKRKGLVVEIYLDVLCGFALAGLAVAVRSALPAARELNRSSGRRSKQKPVRPEQLEWLERQVRVGRAAGDELSPQFRPVVRSIASAQLLRRHGVVLDRSPDRARDLVGDRVWRLVRPDDPETELSAGGFPALVDDLEAI